MGELSPGPACRHRPLGADCVPDRRRVPQGGGEDRHRPGAARRIAWLVSALAWSCIACRSRLQRKPPMPCNWAAPCSRPSSHQGVLTQVTAESAASWLPLGSDHELRLQAMLMLKERRCRFRVLGLSATPGAKREAIQVRSHLASAAGWTLLLAPLRAPGQDPPHKPYLHASIWQQPRAAQLPLLLHAQANQDTQSACYWHAASPTQRFTRRRWWTT